MAISFVGSEAVASTSMTLPAHQAGDILVMFAVRTGNNTPPSIPAAGGTVPTWNNIDSGGANSHSSRIAYAVATANNHTSGTWTNAVYVLCLVYRGQHATPIGAHSGTAANNTQTIVYPALTLNNAGGGSWVLRFGSRAISDSEVANAPSGANTFLNRDFASTSPAINVAGHDTNGGTSSNQTADTVNTTGFNAAYRSWSVELLSGATAIDVTLMPATETDAAHTLTIRQRVTLTRATEADAAQSLALRTRVTLSPAAETDEAQPLTIVTRVALTPGDEASEAQPLAAVKLVALSPGEETDEAQPLSLGGAITVALTPAEETDSAQALAALKLPALAPATSSEAAQPLAIRAAVVLTPAVEQSAAVAPAARKLFTLAPGEEISACVPLTTIKLTSLAAAGETDAALDLVIGAGPEPQFADAFCTLRGPSRLQPLIGPLAVRGLRGPSTTAAALAGPAQQIHSLIGQQPESPLK